MNHASLQNIFVELTKISMSNSFENEFVITQQFFLVVSLIIIDHSRSWLTNEKEKSVIQERMISWSFIYECFHERSKAVILSHYKESWQRRCSSKQVFNTSLQYKSLIEQLDLKIKILCQIMILILATLITVTSFNCSLAATVTVTFRKENFILTSKIVSVTSASDVKSTTNIDNSNSHITISLINVYETQLSLSFASNADDLFSIDNSFIIILSNVSSTHYTFSTEWAERI